MKKVNSIQCTRYSSQHESSSQLTVYLFLLMGYEFLIVSCLIDSKPEFKELEAFLKPFDLTSTGLHIWNLLVCCQHLLGSYEHSLQ